MFYTIKDQETLIIHSNIRQFQRPNQLERRIDIFGNKLTKRYIFKIPEEFITKYFVKM